MISNALIRVSAPLLASRVRRPLKVATAPRDAKWHEWYQAYLDSPRWLEIRTLVMEQYGYRCQGCWCQPASDVHHLTYAHVGHEFLFELVPLCSDCHARIHGRAKP